MSEPRPPDAAPAGLPSVLVVDDDRLTRRSVAATLGVNGREVLTAGDGEEGWQRVLEERPRIIVTDWEMPGVDGPELIRRVRAAGFPHYTYIVLLTGRSALDDVIDGLDGGADDYVTKPFNPRELRARVGIAERILRLEDRLMDVQTELQTLASTDALTGLLNRRAITEHAQTELDRAVREHRPLSLAMVDIDHFKRVNDTHGHLAGDQVLTEVARVLSAETRPYDSVGRWGGEEFMLVLPGTDLPAAAVLADRIRRRMAAHQLDVLDEPLTVSIGVRSLSVGESADLDQLTRDADESLYAAKAAGRNRVEAFEPRDAAA